MNEILNINLALFGEGGAEGGAPAEGTDGATAEEAKPIKYTPKHPKKTGALDNVVYGVQNPAAGDTDTTAKADESAKAEPVAKTEEKTEEQKAAERRQKYDDFKKEYKAEFDKEVQDIMNKRWQKSKETEKRLSDVQPLVEMLSQKYNIEDGDVGKIKEALDSDDRYWEEIADRYGMDIDKAKEFVRLKSENKALAEQQKVRNDEAAAQAQIRQWENEGEALKTVFPDFDLRTEAKNPSFIEGLNKGLSVAQAYKLAHYDDIVSTAMLQTKTATEKQIADNIRAKGNRPLENGISAQSAFITKKDVNALTKEDRAEIARRAKMGERNISF